MGKLIVSLSPHAHGTDTVEKNMYGVIIALMPALLVSFYFFGIGSAIVCATSVAACVFFEWAINKFMLKSERNTVCDGSAILTGLLLGFNLPSNLPIWIIIIGALFAIGVAKMTFGGLGNNLFNPALVGRAALLVAFPAQMTTWPQVGQLGSYLDAETGATPLSIMKDAIKTGDEFRKDASGASLTLTAESIDISTKDGDGVLRTNTGAGINIQTPSMGIAMNKEDGTLIKDSTFYVTSENVGISTDSPKEDGSEITGGGKVAIMSKEITLESMDYQKKDELYTEKGLAADGKISLAAKTIEVSAAKPANVERDENGKITKGNYTAEGDVIVRSKNVSIETVDYDIADGKAKTKAVAKDGKMLLLADKMMLGSEKKDVKSKKFQIVTEELGLFADKTLEAQQGDKKAVMQLADGKAGLGSDGNTIYGDLELKGAVKGPKGTFDSVEAKSAFKSPNISDGVAAGGGAGGSISAKLTPEEEKE